MKLKATLLSLAITAVSVGLSLTASAHERCCSNRHKSCAPRNTCARHTCAKHTCEAHENSSCHRHTAQWNWRHCGQQHKGTGNHHDHSGSRDNSRDDA
jgi:hypothetical protein